MKKRTHYDIVNRIKAELAAAKLRVMILEGKHRIAVNDLVEFKKSVEPIPPLKNSGTNSQVG